MPKTRNTLQREIVLNAVLSLHSHPTAEDIYTYVQTGYPNISRATVYRNLGVLADMGKIRRVSHLDAADRFDHTLAPHYHFRCTACGGVFDVDLPYDGGLLARVPNEAGFFAAGVRYFIHRPVPGVHRGDGSRETWKMLKDPAREFEYK